MEEKNKRKILADLYCLRAGMSLVSDEKEKVKSEDDRARCVTYKIEDNAAEIMNYDSIVSRSKKTLHSAKKEYADAKRKYDKQSFPLTVSAILMFIFAAAATYLYKLGLGGDEYTDIFNILSVACIAVTVYYLLKTVVGSIKIRPLRKRMRHAKDLIRDSQTWITEGSREMKAVEDENRGLKEKASDLGYSKKDAARLSVPIAEAAYAAIHEQYAPMLTPSYWSKLDLIIYLIENEKAESITEALLTVDKNISSGKIEAAVENAHRAVASGYKKDLREISAELDAAYKLLESKLEEQSSRRVEKMKSEKQFSFAGESEIKKHFAKASSCASLKSALANKMTLSSLILAEDMEYIIFK